MSATQTNQNGENKMAIVTNHIEDLFNVYVNSDLTGVIGIAPKSLRNDKAVVTRVNNLKGAQDALCLRWQQMRRGCEVTIKELAELVQKCAGCALELGFFLSISYPDVYAMIKVGGAEYVRNAFSVKERLEQTF